MSIETDDIKVLLKYRHKDDIFVTECKTGSSWFSEIQMLDGWAMKKKWSQPLSVGYEIKISRGDFLNDNKWMGYLPYCNELYFVCPVGLIKNLALLISG